MKSAHYMDIDELDAKLRAEGEAKGEAKGRVSLLQKLLKLKFPQASEQDLAPLASATNEQLECWAERVLSANTLEELFAPRVDQEREPSAHYMDIDELDAKLRAEGEAIGEAKGEARGRMSLLRKQLKLKFPRASEQDLAPLASATNEQIECWAERVLSANTLEEIFA